MRCRRTVRAAPAASAALVAGAALAVSPHAVAESGAAPRAAAPSPSSPVLLNRTVYLDHYQTGLSIGPDGWDTSHDRQVDGYHLADDQVHEAGYRWYISATPEGGEGLRIRNTPGANPRQGRCMEAVPSDHSGLKRKALIWLKPCDSDNPNQRWYVNTNGVPDGTFTLSPQGHPDLAVGPDHNAGAYPGDDWHTRLDTRGPYLGQVWRTRAVSTTG